MKAQPGKHIFSERKRNACKVFLCDPTDTFMDRLIVWFFSSSFNQEGMELVTKIAKGYRKKFAANYCGNPFVPRTLAGAIVSVVASHFHQPFLFLDSESTIVNRLICSKDIAFFCRVSPSTIHRYEDLLVNCLENADNETYAEAMKCYQGQVYPLKPISIHVWKVFLKRLESEIPAWVHRVSSDVKSVYNVNRDPFDIALQRAMILHPLYETRQIQDGIKYFNELLKDLWRMVNARMVIRRNSPLYASKDLFDVEVVKKLGKTNQSKLQGMIKEEIRFEPIIPMTFDDFKARIFRVFRDNIGSEFIKHLERCPPQDQFIALPKLLKRVFSYVFPLFGDLQGSYIGFLSYIRFELDKPDKLILNAGGWIWDDKTNCTISKEEGFSYTGGGFSFIEKGNGAISYPLAISLRETKET